MRVALLSHNARRGDAIGNHVAEKYQFFQQRGAEVRVFLEDGRETHPELTGNCELWAQPEPHGRNWDYLRDCDLVVAEYGHFYPLLHLLPLLARQAPRILVDYHGVTPPALWGRHGREPLVQGVRQRGLVCCADAVLVHSRFTWNELRRECRLPEERLCRIGYVVESPAQGSKNGDLRRQLSLKDATVLLYVGRLATNKRVPLLIDALARLQDVTPPAHLLIVGDDRDVYRVEAERCRARARALGVADRVHFLGHRVGAALADAYRASDLFVTASAWESFCIPVVEAMAHGVPVVAARASALPDTLAGAGLSFTLDDADDLAATVRRSLKARSTGAAEAVASAPKRIAVVHLRTGLGASGVERSLRAIAGTLQRSGHDVEWLEADADSSTTAALPNTEDEFVAALPFAKSLLVEVVARAEEFQAVIVGPYLSRLTYEIARSVPDKTLLLACFHEEPPARRALWHRAYQPVAGLLFHSEAEQTLAQSDLGFNHPNSVLIGTCLEAATVATDAPPPVAGRYLVYCGRFTEEKNLPLVLEYFRRYQAAKPDRFSFACIGAGNIPIPSERGITNLGHVSDAVKSQVLRRADALVNLSCRESLSLAALEAWQVGTPVIAHTDCAVLAAHLGQHGGGAAISDFDSFARTLDDLWQNPLAWRANGLRGQLLVEREHRDESVFAARLSDALDNMTRPLYEQLRDKGMARAREFSAMEWQRRFAAAVEQALSHERDEQPLRIEVRRRVAARRVTPGSATTLVPVHIVNWGTHPALADGPGRVDICARVRNARTEEWVGPAAHTPLPRLIAPGDKVPAAVTVPVPAQRGRYEVVFWAQPAVHPECGPFNSAEQSRYTTTMRLRVGGKPATPPESCSLLLGTVRQELEEANRLQHLPDDYLDVTQGALARLKHRIKHKLLHNFKAAYVDVLSRQQSAFNRQVLNVVQELVECCALLDHAVTQLRDARPQERQSSEHSEPTQVSSKR